mmetsp:Transcript_89839/g.159815  ORF Transcript_89839/g.159815 Transcript_89839/m.159815 type:complete len:277 (-) Transcript_89839:306-1136(-)
MNNSNVMAQKKDLADDMRQVIKSLKSGACFMSRTMPTTRKPRRQRTSRTTFAFEVLPLTPYIIDSPTWMATRMKSNQFQAQPSPKKNCRRKAYRRSSSSTEKITRKAISVLSSAAPIASNACRKPSISSELVLVVFVLLRMSLCIFLCTFRRSWSTTSPMNKAFSRINASISSSNRQLFRKSTKLRCHGDLEASARSAVFAAAKPRSKTPVCALVLAFLMDTQACFESSDCSLTLRVSASCTCPGKSIASFKSFMAAGSPLGGAARASCGDSCSLP